MATTEELRLGYLAIALEFMNLAELKWCLALQAEASPPPTLGHVLKKEGYVSQRDLEYLEMVMRAKLERGDPDPLLTAEELSIDRIERAVVARLGRALRGGTFGRFRVLGQVGRGGMGLVLKVEDGQDPTPLALKILVGSGGATVKDIERFKKEAAIMAAFQAQTRHPNIVQIYDVGREKGLDYIVMEFIDGLSLAELLDERLPTLQESLEIARGVADALRSIHNRAIYHRDLKPANVMLESTGRPVLMDFGLAVFEKFEATGRRKRGSVGTPQYQPPEQADVGGEFGPIGPASDVYGLGATLYHLLTGAAPFEGTDRNEIRQQVLTVEPRPPREVNADVPVEVEKLVLRCLQKRAEDRYPNTVELIKDLDRLLGKGPKPPARRLRF